MEDIIENISKRKTFKENMSKKRQILVYTVENIIQVHVKKTLINTH
jgi:hypothetical protein